MINVKDTKTDGWTDKRTNESMNQSRSY